MRILIALTYYRPHYSGLTIYTERLARALAARGHQVTVLTSRFNPDLLPEEICDNVRVIRLHVAMRISKGVIMPSILARSLSQIRQADMVNLHVPQLDAAPIAVMARLLRKPVVLTYHCDLQLPHGFIHRIANLVSHLANHISALAANVIVTNTRDYAEHSPFLKHYLSKVYVIPPAVDLPKASQEEVQQFRLKYGLEPDQPIIGMAARLATEKGVEYLVEALPGVLEQYPRARVLFVGQYQNVLGEEQYAAKLAPLIKHLGDHWTFLGVIPQNELAAFFQVSDVTVLPSINGTESFGMVQVEAMSCGTPVISSNLPGVRVPVQSTGMGRVVPARDPEALRQALNELLKHSGEYRDQAMTVTRRYAPQTIASEYENIFLELVNKP